MIIYVDQYKVIDLKDCRLSFEKITVCGNSSDDMIMKFRNFRITDSGPVNPGKDLMSEGKVTTHGIMFNLDNTIKPESMGTLNHLSRALNENPELRIEIAVFSDDTANNPEKNNTLRAETVKAILIKMGINENRLFAVGYGAGFVINNNVTNSEMANNRRVEFKTIK
ncbi:MAG: OmpA family protein [Ignavibacteria bacterium]|nr:OmpA family protein [Ignavibacteria bacterium]